MKSTLTFLLLLALRLSAATYYVDPDNGSDSNNGLGPDASHGTNKPWLTLGKVFSTVSSGDIIYFAPGSYREVNTITATSWTSETTLRGDPRNIQGFRNGSGVRKPPGVVRITGYTTNDTTAGTATNLIILNGRDYITFEDFYFEPYRLRSAIDADTATSTNITFRRCYFQCHSNTSDGMPIEHRAGFGVPVYLTVENCIFWNVGAGASVRFVYTSGTGSDWDPEVVIRNNLFFAPSSTAIQWIKSGANANVAGGADITGNTIIASNGLLTGSASSTYPFVVKNNVMNCSSRCYTAENTSQITSDFNYLLGITADSNTTRGADDEETDWAGHLDIGASQLFGLSSGLPPFSPFSFSPMLGGGEGNNLSTDLYNAARPNPNSIGSAESKTSPVRSFAQ